MPGLMNNSKGFTLIEVMIALVVLAIGMLGLASIQAVGLQNNATAYMRTLAMQSAYNMADMIRTANGTDGTVTATYNNVTSTLGSAPASCIQNDTSLPDCSSSAMAAFDIYQWKERLADILPSGRGAVTRTTDIYEIKIMWDEDRTGVTGENCSGNSSVDLKCYTLHVQI